MSRHALIVGAGVIGLNAARDLRRRGYDVTVLDRTAPEHEGASHGNAGIVVPSSFEPLAAPGMVAKALKWMADPTSPFYVKPRASFELAAWGWRFLRAATAARAARAAPVLLDLNLQSRALYDELVADLGVDVGFVTRGTLMLCATDAGLAHEAAFAAQANALGLEARVLDATAVRAMEPDIELDVVGAVHVPADAHADPGATMRALRSRLERDGVRFVAGVEATAVRARGDGVAVDVRTVAGAVPAAGTEPPSTSATHTGDALVLAGGSWSAQLARDLGLRLLLQPGKGYTLTLEHPSQVLHTAALLVEAKAAATEVGARFRIGGTMEIAGFDPRLNPARLEGIKRAARRFFPALPAAELNAATPWMGFRPVSPDGLPYLGRAPRHPNVVVATGHAMMGFSLGPITGRLVGELVAGERPSVDLPLLDPARHT